MEEKLILCSDSHGERVGLEYLHNTYPRSCRFLHCGDSVLHPYELDTYGFISVQGNNDYYNAYPMHRVLHIAGHDIYMCHGHRDMFFENYAMLADKAKSLGCDIALCGHSHIYHNETVNGVLCLNPGSIWRNRDLSEPSYMEITFKDRQVMVERRNFRHDCDGKK